MKAVIYTKPKELTFFENYQLKQKPRLDDVILSIKSVGICGSDMHAYHGKDPRRNPGLILGHEFCGEIIEGENKGSLVVGNPLITCGECDFCQQGRDNLCSNRDMIGMNRQGAFAEFLQVPQKCLVEIPLGMNPNNAALTEPAATVVHAVNLTINSSFRPLQENNILVIGAGAIGFLTALLLKNYGANVEILETNPLRQQEVKKHIKVKTLNPKTDKISNDKYQTIFDCVGNTQTNKLAVEKIISGGIVTNIGLQSWSCEIDLRKITLQEIKLIGCYTYTMQDFKFALKALNQGLFGDLNWLKTLELKQANIAFKDLDNGRIASAKVILKP